MGITKKPNRFKPYQMKQYLSVMPQEFIYKKIVYLWQRIINHSSYL